MLSSWVLRGGETASASLSDERKLRNSTTEHFSLLEKDDDQNFGF